MSKPSLLTKNEIAQVYKPIYFSTIVSDNLETERIMAILTAMCYRKVAR